MAVTTKHRVSRACNDDGKAARDEVAARGQSDGTVDPYRPLQTLQGPTQSIAVQSGKRTTQGISVDDGETLLSLLAMFCVLWSRSLL